jgi:hypothetical protein
VHKASFVGCTYHCGWVQSLKKTKLPTNLNPDL